MRGFHTSSFDPPTLVVLEAAFDEAWLTLLKARGVIAEDLRRQVWPRLPNRTNFRPLIDRVFKFAEAPEAHERMERGEHVGKIVLIP